MEVPDIINYLLSPELQEKLFPFKFVFIIFSALFLVGIIILASKTSYLRLRFFQGAREISSFRPYGTQKAIKQWRRIRKRASEDDVEVVKLAILEADKMVDNILKRLGYEGKDLDEKLEKIDRNIIPSIDLLKENHKTSEGIIKNYRYYLSLRDGRRIIDNYQKVLEELQVF